MKKGETPMPINLRPKQKNRIIDDILGKCDDLERAVFLDLIEYTVKMEKELDQLKGETLPTLTHMDATRGA